VILQQVHETEAYYTCAPEPENVNFVHDGECEHYNENDARDERCCLVNEAVIHITLSPKQVRRARVLFVL
jgi:hypothetical protein